MKSLWENKKKKNSCLTLLGVCCFPAAFSSFLNSLSLLPPPLPPPPPPAPPLLLFSLLLSLPPPPELLRLFSLSFELGLWEEEGEGDVGALDGMEVAGAREEEDASS